MKRAIPLLPVLALVLVLTACASAQVSTDYDRTADFSQYRTYAWIAGTEAANPLVEQRIRSAVDRQLAARGFTKVTSSPDFQVATHASVSEEKEVDMDTLGYGFAGGGWGSTMVNIRNIDVGTLLLDLVDASSEQLVWRGEATGTVGVSVTQEKVDKVVERMLSTFPPANG